MVVVRVMRARQKLDEVVSECERAGGKATAIQADLNSTDGARAAVDACVQQLGGLNILVNSGILSLSLPCSLVVRCWD
jgi:3-oxoacyl-[acyl-carrier protein] reductase